MSSVLRSSYQLIVREQESTDMMKGLPHPPLEKPVSSEETVIALPVPEAGQIKKNDLFSFFKKRRSRRKFTSDGLTLRELAYLLWATQGVARTFADNPVTFRTVPSAGAKHPFETYLLVFNVEGLEPGVYRYLALSHALAGPVKTEKMQTKLTEALFGADFPSRSSVVFVWAAVPQRTRWKYGSQADKFILMDAGHICQNLYLAADSLDLGTCAMAGYDQEKLDALLGLDGENELAVYLAPVGRK